MATVSLANQLLTVAIISLQRQLYHNRRLDTGAKPLPQSSYDFIVVGSGTAGSIVAGRLSENPSVSVLLIEAGGPQTVTSDIVSTYYSFNYDWGYRTVPQANAGNFLYNKVILLICLTKQCFLNYTAFGLNNRQVPVVRGRVFGGSHTLNFVGYIRNNVKEWDSWESEYGATGWNYDTIFPYFLRTENNTDPAVVAARPNLHSTSGPLEISTAPDPQPILNRWVDAATRLGWPRVDFSDGRKQYGTGILQTTQSASNWTRQTTASAFIEVNIARPNLHVLLNSQVTRVLFDTSTFGSSSQPRAVGVEYVRASDGRSFQIFANREVILSAGVINSPQLLMLSGSVFIE